MLLILPKKEDLVDQQEELIDNGVNGYLCDLKDENEFIEKLNLLVNDKDIYEKIKNNSKNYFRRLRSRKVAIKEIREKIL